jgi:hypothetical protein
MAKTLKDILEVYEPKSPDEKRFKDKHITVKTKDRNGNGDDVFNAKNIKTVDRKKENHGYNPGEDEKVYEEKMTAADKAKEKSLKKKYDPSGMKASMKKQYGAEKGEQVYFAKIRKQAMEEVEQIDEAVAGDMYDAHHARAMKSLQNMAKHLDKHKKLCYKNKGPMSWHASEMKALSRQLEDMEQGMAQTNEYAMPLNPVEKSS